MINIKIGISIYCPVKRVFEFISTPENDFQWQYGTLASAPFTEETNKAGNFFRSESHFLGLRSLSTYEITEFETNKTYGFKSLSGPLQSFTTYTFNIAKGCTLVDMSMQANAVNLIDINEHVLEKRVKKQLKENMAMLKNILESE